MKKIKVLKNFGCNGVKKKVGQYLSEDERDKIGSKFGKKLLHEDFIQVEGLSKKEDENENPESDEKLEDMEKPALLEYAKKLGIKIHAKSGEDKIRELIKEKLES